MNNFDKFLHFLVCMMTVIIADIFLPLWASILIASSLAVSKEVYDYFNPEKHSADWVDLAADFFGILVAVGIILS